MLLEIVSFNFSEPKLPPNTRIFILNLLKELFFLIFATSNLDLIKELLTGLPVKIIFF